MKSPDYEISSVPQDDGGHIVETQRAAAAALLGGTPGKGLSVIQATAQAMRAASRIGDSSPDAPRRACRAGCSACCHLAVAILPAEALVIADGLRRTRDEAALAATIERIRGTASRVSQLTIEQRALARVPCALLSDEGACTIHEFRPIGCRGWTSFDREQCEAALRDAQPGHTGPQDHLNHVAAGCVTEGLQRAFGAAGLTAGHREFHAALWVALMNEQAGDRLASGEPIFDDCPRVVSDKLRAIRGGAPTSA